MSPRVNQAEQEGTAIVDVDGSYLYRKYESLTEAGDVQSRTVLKSVIWWYHFATG